MYGCHRVRHLQVLLSYQVLLFNILNRSIAWVPVLPLPFLFISLISSEQCVSYFSFRILILLRRLLRPTDSCVGLLTFLSSCDCSIPIPLSSMQHFIALPRLVNEIVRFFAPSQSIRPCHIAFSASGCSIKV